MHAENRIASGNTCLFNRFFILTCLVGLCINIGQSVTTNAVSVYLNSLGFSTRFTGLVGIPYAVLAIIARVVSGYLSDSRGRRFVMILGCVLFALSCFAFGYVQWAALLMLLRSLQGAGYAFSFTGTTAANLDVTPKNKEKEGVGIFWVPLAIAIAVSGQLVLWLSSDGSYGRVYLAAGLILTIGILFAVLCSYEKTNPVARAEKGTYRGLSLWIEPRALPTSSIMFLFAIAMSSITAFIMLFAEQRTYPNTGLFFMIGAASMFAGNLLSAKLHRRFGAVLTLCTAFAAFAVLIVWMALSESKIVFLLNGMTYGYIQGISSPVLCSLVMERLPANRRGAGSSTLYMMLDIGIGLGSFLWGLVIRGLGFTAVYCGAGLFAIMALVLTVAFYGKKRTKTEPEE